MSNIASSVVDSVKNGIQYAEETAEQSLRGASKESNKSVAKGEGPAENANLETRASAAWDATKDSAAEHKHKVNAEGHKQAS